MNDERISCSIAIGVMLLAATSDMRPQGLRRVSSPARPRLHHPKHDHLQWLAYKTAPPWRRASSPPGSEELGGALGGESAVAGALPQQWRYAGLDGAVRRRNTSPAAGDRFLSQTSKRAFDAAVRMARAFGARLHLLHVNEEEQYFLGHDAAEVTHSCATSRADGLTG